MIKPAYSVSFLLSINIFVWQNVLYVPNVPLIIVVFSVRYRQPVAVVGIGSVLCEI